VAPKKTEYSSTEQKPHGDAVLERLDAVTIPKELKPYVAGFLAVHTEFGAKQKAVVATKLVRDAQVSTVIDADTAHDVAVIGLANDLVGARLGSRANPFADFSSLTQSKLTSLPYKKQIAASRALVKAVLAKEPAKPVAKAAKRVAAAATALEKAIGGLAKPQAAYDKALADRDTLLPEWALALDRLNRKATGTWADDPAMVQTLFADPSAMEAGKTKRPKKKGKGTPKPE
jgi:hypothetical protein